MSDSKDKNLKDLLDKVDTGAIRLPEFQRGWTWDDNRIRGILASITQDYPMGAILCLQYDDSNPNMKFSCRKIEGVEDKKATDPAELLILDGQQRLTSIYNAIYSKNPVKTKTENSKEIERYYYLLMEDCFNDDIDRIDAILSIPADRKLKENFDRDIKLDLSDRKKEFEHKAFPLNIIFDDTEYREWFMEYWDYYKENPEARELFNRFAKEIINKITQYQLPVITLPKSTPKEAVCKVFENVNTGGVSLTVFELVTATFAMEDFNLREDWELCEKRIRGVDKDLSTDLLDGIDETTFLTSVTLYTSYMKKQKGLAGAVSCKKRDVLALDYHDYIHNKEKVLEGFDTAREFLLNYQCVYRKRDLPYTTQLIPLAAICAVLGNSECENPRTIDILAKWYWCGILGEMYGAANETRYANDIEDVINEIRGAKNQIRTVNSAFFASTRLLGLQTRGSAAYKGIMALLYKQQCQDFMNPITIDSIKSMTQSPDIHHIFPEAYCEKTGIEKKKYNSIVNKTPMLAKTNRTIGGHAPSVYIKTIKHNVPNLTDDKLKERVESHLINYDMLVDDNFESYFIDRAKKLLALIEKEMGKPVADKGSEETIQQFGASLMDS